jgi:hypothetical protein
VSRLLVLLLPIVLAAAAPAQERKTKDGEAKDPPTLLYPVPLVAKPGERQTLALRGRNLDTLSEVKVTGAGGAAVKLLGKKKAPPGANQSADKAGDTEAEVELELPKEIKPGGVKLTAVNPNGESRPYPLLVRDGTPAVAEKEPNDGFDAAQAVPLPCAVEGVVGKEKDADVYRFEGKKGDRLRVEVQAARWGSPVDALVTVSDADRRTLAAADDANGSPDPVVTLTLPRDGAYFVALIDAHDAGGPGFGYRLVLANGRD